MGRYATFEACFKAVFTRTLYVSGVTDIENFASQEDLDYIWNGYRTMQVCLTSDELNCGMESNKLWKASTGLCRNAQDTKRWRIHRLVFVQCVNRPCEGSLG